MTRDYDGSGIVPSYTREIPADVVTQLMAAAVRRVEEDLNAEIARLKAELADAEDIADAAVERWMDDGQVDSDPRLDSMLRAWAVVSGRLPAEPDTEWEPEGCE